MRVPPIFVETWPWALRALGAAGASLAVDLLFLFAMPSNASPLGRVGLVVALLVGMAMVARWPMPLWQRILGPLACALLMLPFFFVATASTVCARFGACL